MSDQKSKIRARKAIRPRRSPYQNPSLELMQIDTAKLQISSSQSEQETEKEIGCGSQSINQPHNDSRAVVPYIESIAENLTARFSPGIEDIFLENNIFDSLRFENIHFPWNNPSIERSEFHITHLGKKYIFNQIPIITPPNPNIIYFPLRSKLSIKMGEPIFSAKDLSFLIPEFNGDENKLESFINICSKYYSMMKNDQAALFLAIVQTKIVGEALDDLQPIDDLKSWDAIKAKLQEKVKTPETYEFAQEQLSLVRQKRGESVEDFGKRIRKGLEKLNLATKSLTRDENALKPLRTANEKHAIHKFEQNMFDEKIKLMVGAANFSNLREAITFAISKELFQRTNTNKTCSFCKNIGHTEDECRKKASQMSPRKEQKPNYNFSRGVNSNDFRRSFPQRTYDNRNRNDQGNYYGNYNRNFNRNDTDSTGNRNFQYRTNNFQGNNYRSNSQDSNRNGQNGETSNNFRPKNGSTNATNSRHENNTARNLRTIQEVFNYSRTIQKSGKPQRQ